MSETESPNGMGIQIKLLRKANDMSQKQLAKITGMSREQISRIESGEHVPTMLNMVKICNALNAKLAIVFDANVINEKNSIKNGTAERELFSEQA
jgi:XRE family transcriptional regulator, regulator of sulfur utilization